MRRIGCHPLARRRRPATPVAAILAVSGMAALAACQANEPPEQVLAEAPPPAPAALSRLSAPVEYDFTPILSVVERAVPTALGSMDEQHTLGLDPRKRFAFEAARGPFRAFVDDGVLHLRTTVAYQVRGYYKPFIGPTLSAGCGSGDDRPRLVLELTSRLGLTEDWHLKTHARLTRLEPATESARDRCVVSIVKRDVTESVMEAAGTAVRKHLPEVDRKVARLDLRDRFAGWWGLLARPIRLSDGVWLLIAPERVAIGQVSGHAHVLTVPVSVDARPRIVATDREPQADTPALPPLGRARAMDGFHILLEGTLDYPTANGLVQKALAGKPLRSDGHEIVVDSVSVDAAPRGRLALSIAFHGDARGIVRLVGRPELDPGRHELVVPDLDFDLDTDSKLLAAYAWLKSDELRSVLREKAHVPVAPALDRARDLLLSGLNREISAAVALHGTVDAVAVRAVYATRAGVILRGEATGTAGVVIRQPETNAVASGGSVKRASGGRTVKRANDGSVKGAGNAVASRGGMVARAHSPVASSGWSVKAAR